MPSLSLPETGAAEAERAATAQDRGTALLTYLSGAHRHALGPQTPHAPSRTRAKSRNRRRERKHGPPKDRGHAGALRWRRLCRAAIPRGNSTVTGTGAAPSHFHMCLPGELQRATWPMLINTQARATCRQSPRGMCTLSPSLQSACSWPGPAGLLSDPRSTPPLLLSLPLSLSLTTTSLALAPASSWVESSRIKPSQVKRPPPLPQRPSA